MNKPPAGNKQGLVGNKDNTNLSPQTEIVNALLTQDILPVLAEKLIGITHGSVICEIVVHDRQYRLNFTQTESRIPGKPMSGSTVSSVPVHWGGDGVHDTATNYCSNAAGMSRRYEK